MASEMLSPAERDEIRDLFGVLPDEMDLEGFEKKLKELRQRYHPDQFEGLNNEVVREMAKEKFQRIEGLSARLRTYLEGGKQAVIAPAPTERYGYDRMRIEIITRNKDLKYLLFGTQYRWLERGDKFKIPGTQAYLVLETSHRGMAIGFTEAIKMYLTFGPEDSLEEIGLWLVTRLTGHADGLLIEGQRIPVDLMEMLRFIRRKALLLNG